MTVQHFKASDQRALAQDIAEDLGERPTTDRHAAVAASVLTSPWLEEHDRQTAAAAWVQAIEHLEPHLGAELKRAAMADNPFAGAVAPTDIAAGQRWRSRDPRDDGIVATVLEVEPTRVKIRRFKVSWVRLDRFRKSYERVN